MICHSPSTQERDCAYFPNSSTAYRYRGSACSKPLVCQVFAQVAHPWAVQQDSPPRRPSGSPSSEAGGRGGTPALQQYFSSSLHHLESSLKIRFLGLAMELLHQHHRRKGLELSHFKHCPSNSTH